MTVETGNVGALVEHAPRSRLQHARDSANERRLAGAVGADDGNDFAFGHVERHAGQSLRVAVEEIEGFDAQHQCAAFMPR